MFVIWNKIVTQNHVWKFDFFSKNTLTDKEDGGSDITELTNIFEANGSYVLTTITLTPPFLNFLLTLVSICSLIGSFAFSPIPLLPLIFFFKEIKTL